MKHFKEIICIKSGIVSSSYTNQFFEVKKGDIFAVVGYNNGEQMCITDESGETMICLLHNHEDVKVILKSDNFDCYESIPSYKFAEFNYVN